MKWWKDVLVAYITNTDFFPKEVERIGKITAANILQNISVYQREVESLKKGSKENSRNSYTIKWEYKTFDKVGKQTIPDKIIFETIDDYLKFVGKEAEYQIFKDNFQLIADNLPVLKSWVSENPLKLIEHDMWNDTLKVCRYFIANPTPNLYIRQLPIDIHTKYIEENESLIASLLNYLIPENVNRDEKDFEKRFNLKYSEPLMRLRFLDEQILRLPQITDISLTLTEIHQFSPKCRNIIVVENKMNFLTLPLLPDTIALWSGGGFNVAYLRDIEWLKSRQFYYWGDIDTAGFQILNQFRSYFPGTISVMMDEETLNKFWNPDDKRSPNSPNQALQHLTDKEMDLYQYLKQTNIRLEQEKIGQQYAETILLEIINP